MPSTGIKKLDETLMDGIPQGFSILVKGVPGSGMGLFAKQFASGGKGEKIVYFATGESEEEVLEGMGRYKWTTDIDVRSMATEYYEKVLARDLEASRLRREGMSKKEIAELGKSEKRVEINFLEELVYEISKLKKNYRAVVNSLDFFLEHYPAEEVLSAVRTVESHLKYTKGLALFTLTKDICDKRVESGIHATVDCVMELEVERVGTAFESRIVIKKVKDKPEKMAVLIYSVSDTGITPEVVTRIG